ncbi:hypothetical protein AAY473_022718 [Plecturocebus cupreus]
MGVGDRVCCATQAKYRGTIMAHCSLDLPGLSNPPTSVTQIAGTTGVYHHAWLSEKEREREREKKNRILLCCPGWSQTPGLKRSACLDHPTCWDYRHEPLYLAKKNFFKPMCHGLTLSRRLPGWNAMAQSRFTATSTTQAQADLELLTSGDPPPSASQSAGIIGFERVSLRSPSWSAVARTRLTATFTSGAQAILLPQPPKRLRRADHLRSGVRDQPGQHGETPSLPKIQKLAGRDEFHHIGQAGLELLTSSDTSALASLSAGITGMNHCAQPDVMTVERRVLLCHPGWSAVARSRLTATSASWVQHFGRLKQVDHLRLGVQDQPDQPGETPSLLKVRKLAGCGGACLWFQLLERLRQENRLNSGGGGCNWEIPSRGATRVASVILLAGTAVLPVPQCGASWCGVYGTDGLGWSHPHKENGNWKR